MKKIMLRVLSFTLAVGLFIVFPIYAIYTNIHTQVLFVIAFYYTLYNKK